MSVECDCFIANDPILSNLYSYFSQTQKGRGWIGIGIEDCQRETKSELNRIWECSAWKRKEDKWAHQSENRQSSSNKKDDSWLFGQRQNWKGSLGHWEQKNLRKPWKWLKLASVTL